MEEEQRQELLRKMQLSHTMRLFSSICLLLWGLFVSVQARSAVGDRVLVVLEDSAEKELYSKFWTDLECKSMVECSEAEICVC